MAVGQDKKAPYAPAEGVIKVLEGYRDRGLSTPFTLDVMVRAGVSESLAPRTLAALRHLGLIDGKGNPRPELADLRQAPSDEYQDRFAAVFRSAYADVLNFVDPETASLQRIEDAFRPYKPEGQRARMVSLFQGLARYAGIAAPDQTSKKPRPAKTIIRKTKPKPPGGESAEVHRNEEPAARNSDRDRLGLDIDETIIGLVSKLPPRGGTWSKARRDRFLTLFTGALDFVYEIENSDAPANTGASDQVPNRGGHMDPP